MAISPLREAQSLDMIAASRDGDRVDADAIPPRRLRIVVGRLAIEDGQPPPPARGEAGCYRLRFREVDSDERGAVVTSFQASAQPLYDGSPVEHSAEVRPPGPPCYMATAGRRPGRHRAR